MHSLMTSLDVNPSYELTTPFEELLPPSETGFTESGVAFEVDVSGEEAAEGKHTLTEARFSEVAALRGAEKDEPSLQ